MSTQRNARPGWIAWSILAVAVVLVAGNLPRLATTAQGDVREGPRPQSFLSGGERSEAVLKEISETLKRIDLRLERFEKALRETEPAPNRQPEAAMGAEGDAAGQPAPAGAAADGNPANR